MVAIPNRVGDPDFSDAVEAPTEPSADSLWAKAFEAIRIAAEADRRDAREKSPAVHTEYVRRPNHCGGANLVSFATVDGVEQRVWTRRRCTETAEPGLGRCMDCIKAERNNLNDLREQMRRHTQPTDPAKRRGF